MIGSPTRREWFTARRIKPCMAGEQSYRWSKTHIPCLRHTYENEYRIHGHAQSILIFLLTETKK